MKKLAIFLVLCLLPLIFAIETEINFDFAGLIPEGGGDQEPSCPDCTCECPAPVEDDIALVVGETVSVEGWAAMSTFFFYNATSQEPIEMGLRLSGNALSVFRRRIYPETGGAYMIDLPDEAKAFTPFNFVMLNYNPFGHEPTAIFGKEHFDVHFYMSDEELVNEVTPGTCETVPGSLVDCDTFEWVTGPVDPSLLPANYIWLDNPIPFMGDHAVDPTEHAFTQPGSFSDSLLFGRINGSVVFWEAMTTFEYLESHPENYGVLPIPQPENVEFSGYYPTVRGSYYDDTDKAYYFWFSDFEYRDGLY